MKGQKQHGVESVSGIGRWGSNRLRAESALNAPGQHLRPNLQPLSEHGFGSDDRVDAGLRVRPKTGYRQQASGDRKA